MKKILRTAGILLAIFLVAVCFFTIQLNKKEKSEGIAAENPTLPVGYMEVGNTRVNEMYGYKREIRELSERESLTPIGTDRALVFSLDTYGNVIDSVYYQVTSLENGEMIENGDIRDFSVQDGTLTAAFALRTNIRTGQEYMLRMAVQIGEAQTVYYYTRLLQISGADIAGYLNFAEWFCRTCCDKATSDTVINYIEPDNKMANRSYADVNLHSSLEMLGWGNLYPTLAQAPTPRIVEINVQTMSVVCEYTISANNTAGDLEYYHVEDFFRLGKATDETMVLLNFQRQASLVFDGNLPFQTENGMDLGIQSRSINYKINEDADIAAVVLNGDLWMYNQYTGKIVRVFSFRKESPQAVERPLDVREEYTNHDIAVEQVSRKGDIAFVVYGYMPAGTHEGSMGVSVCQYSVDTDTVEEKMFIPLNQAYSILSSNIARLSYISGDELYLFLGTQLCRINLENGSYNVIQDSIPADGFAVSDTQETVAWLNGSNEGAASQAKVMNLRTGSTMDIKAPEGEAIISCGFINEDFVYGLARIQDIRIDNSGRVICGMYRLCIQSIDGTLKKDYLPNGEYVVRTVKEAEGMELTLAKLATGYIETGMDHIINNERGENSVTLVPAVYERTQEKMMLVFPQTVRSPKAEEINAGVLNTDAGAETILEWPDNSQNMYYVYGGGRLLGVYRHENLAIQAADAAAGVVLNSRQQYIWERGNWGVAYTIDANLLPPSILNVGMDIQGLQTALGDSYEVLDLAGCTQESLKYMLSKGYPVIAQGRDQVYLILGYDQYNIWVYRPGKTPKAIASDDSLAEFLTQGNKFLTYIRK